MTASWRVSITKQNTYTNLHPFWCLPLNPWATILAFDSSKRHYSSIVSAHSAFPHSSQKLRDVAYKGGRLHEGYLTVIYELSQDMLHFSPASMHSIPNFLTEQQEAVSRCWKYQTRFHQKQSLLNSNSCHSTSEALRFHVINEIPFPTQANLRLLTCHTIHTGTQPVWICK